MPNEMKEYTITITCNAAFYKALVTMLRYAKKLGQERLSRRIAIHFRGEDFDKIHDVIISDAVKPSDKGIIVDFFNLQYWPPHLQASLSLGDFLIDTAIGWDL